MRSSSSRAETEAMAAKRRARAVRDDPKLLEIKIQDIVYSIWYIEVEIEDKG